MSALLAPDVAGVQSLIFYFSRRNLHHHVYTAATQGLAKRPNDPVLIMWKGFALFRENRTSEAIRELESVRGKQGVQLPVLICLKLAHESAKHTDREAVDSITKDLATADKSADKEGLLLAAALHLLQRDNKKARELIGRVLETNPTFSQASIIFSKK